MEIAGFEIRTMSIPNRDEPFTFITHFPILSSTLEHQYKRLGSGCLLKASCGLVLFLFSVLDTF